MPQSLVSLTTFLIQVLNGLQYGMLLFLIASGLTITFGVMGIINLAHGAFFMAGAYLAFHFTKLAGFSFAAAYLSAIIAVVVLSAIVEHALLAPLAKRDHLDQVLVTYGLVLIFDELAVMLWGKDVQPAEIPKAVSESITLFGTLVYPAYRLFIIGVGLTSAIALYLLIAKTKLGIIARAGSVDPDLVRALGIPVGVIFTVVFAIGAALAALAGIIAAPILSVSPGMGDRIIILAFVVVVIGGVGSVLGAFVGAVLIGLVDAFGKALMPSLSSLLMYALMAAVLIWRPQGLLGSVRR